MNTTLSGYNVKGRKGLSHWDSLLEEWLLAIERYCRVMNGEDAPYSYNERANLGLLSAAAWRSGWIALEEFQREKGHSNKKKMRGRADLWIANGDNEELIEAKFKWICMGSSAAVGHVNSAINEATRDATKSRANDKEIKSVGLGFFPCYKKYSRIKNIEELIQETIDEISTCDHHAIAWSFPKQTRAHKSKNGDILPGIIMVAKNVDYD